MCVYMHIFMCKLLYKYIERKKERNFNRLKKEKQKGIPTN